jgi:hypothetical protein
LLILASNFGKFNQSLINFSIAFTKYLATTDISINFLNEVEKPKEISVELTSKQSTFAVNQGLEK